MRTNKNKKINKVRKKTKRGGMFSYKRSGTGTRTGTGTSKGKTSGILRGLLSSSRRINMLDHLNNPPLHRDITDVELKTCRTSETFKLRGRDGLWYYCGFFDDNTGSLYYTFKRTDDDYNNVSILQKDVQKVVRIV